MARISEQSIEKVRQTANADIVEVVGSYIELKQKGRDFKGLCPFHNDSNPSLSVSPEREMFKCFSCGAGGSAINFVMDYKKLDFPDAVKTLAEKYNIVLEIQGGDSKKFRDTKSQLIDIHKYAAKYYHNILLSDEGKEAYTYLKERGLSDDIIKQFQLGLSTDNWYDLLNLVKKEGFSSEVIEESKLFNKGKKSGKYFDFFRSRIMFPIQKQQGEYIAFGARQHLVDDGFGKYTNSRESAIYHKSNVLYGLNHNLQDIRVKKEIILVEGYMDLIQLVQAGITNCLAICGTAFTDGHANILKRFTNKIYITLDGDDKGQKFAIKCGYILIKNGLEPKIVTPPNKMDPDDWIRETGSKGLNDGIKNAQSIIKAHYNFFSSNNDRGSLAINDFIEKCLEELKLILNPIVKELMINEISDLTNIDKRNINQVLNQKISIKYKQDVRKRKPISNDNNLNPITSPDKYSSKLYDDIIRLCFAEDKKIRTLIFENLNDKWFLSALYKDIYSNIYIHLKSEDAPPVKVIAEQMIRESREKLISLKEDLDKYKFNHSYSSAIESLVRIEQKFLQSSVDDLRLKLRDNNNIEILEQLKSIEEKIKSVKSKYDQK